MNGTVEDGGWPLAASAGAKDVNASNGTALIGIAGSDNLGVGGELLDEVVEVGNVLSIAVVCVEPGLIGCLNG